MANLRILWLLQAFCTLLLQCFMNIKCSCDVDVSTGIGFYTRRPESYSQLSKAETNGKSLPPGKSTLIGHPVPSGKT